MDNCPVIVFVSSARIAADAAAKNVPLSTSTFMIVIAAVMFTSARSHAARSSQVRASARPQREKIGEV